MPRLIPARALSGVVPNAPLRFFVVGDLASAVAAAIGGPIIDYLFIPEDFTITAIDLLCPDSPSSGSISIDVLRATNSGGAFTSLYSSNTKPSLTCVGNTSFATFNGDRLPETASIAGGSVLAVRLTAAPVGANDLYVSIR